MVPAPLSITAVDLASVPGDVLANVAAAAEAIRSSRAEVVLFPELFLSSYALELGPDDVVSPTDERLAPISGACAETGRHALVSAAVAGEDGVAHIGILWADPGGGPIRAAYAKQNLDPPEMAAFTAGSRASSAIIEVDGWKLGLGVCYDAAFPEHARRAALDGADAYLLPSAYPAGGGQQRRHIYLQARALENTLYVISADCAGALAFGPDGIERDGDLVLLDAATLAETRSRMTMLEEARRSAEAAPDVPAAR